MQLSIDQIIGYLHLLLFVFVVINLLASILIKKFIKHSITNTVFYYWSCVVAVFFFGGLFHSIEILSHLILIFVIFPVYFVVKVLYDEINYKFPVKPFLAIHFSIGFVIGGLLYINNAPSYITAIPAIAGEVFYLFWAGIIALSKRKQYKRLSLTIFSAFYFFGAFVQLTYPLSLLSPTLSIAGWVLAFFGYQFGSPLLFAIIIEKFYLNEKEKLIETMNAFERFVPKNLLHLLQKDDITTVELGDNRSEKMTILFAKINSFSELVSQLSPEDVLNLLNISYSAIEPIIYKHNGFVNNLHDGTLTAIFPKSPLDSINASIEMKDALKQLNHNLNLDGFKSINVGIGIDFGKSIIGTTGSKNRMQGTVISTSINMAEELAKLSETYKSTILITGHALISFDKSVQYQFEFVDNKYLKGRNTPVTIYEVTGNAIAS